MSLFKAREWWSTTSGFEEFHDLGCLCAANIDNSPSGHDKLIVGSFQGLVRIYEPRPPSFSADHVILERQMSSPVLQVAAGQFVSGSSQLHLAVLHPRQLSVCTLTSEETDEQGLTYLLTIVYSHTLFRTACNMTWGKFGGVKERDHICVQSMDGHLSFFIQDSLAFTCFLPDFLLPGPLAYLSQSDSLVTVNSAHMLQVFRYQGISMSTSIGDSNTGKKITVDWSANLGEHAVDIKVMALSATASYIVVLGEHSVFCFHENGVLHFMKKLDFNPSCFHVYNVLPSEEDGSYGQVQYMVSSHTDQLLVFSGPALIWTATLNHPPVHITTAHFKELDGVIVSLDELGHLTCSYLGTDPTLFTAPIKGQREINYEEIDRELSELNAIVKSSHKEGVAVRSETMLVMKWEVLSEQIRMTELRDAELEDSPSADDVQEEGSKPMSKVVEVKLLLSSSTGPVLNDVTVTISSTLPLTTHPSHFTLPEVLSTHGNEPLVVTVVCTPSLLPTSTSITLSATYKTHSGELQILTKTVDLPIHLFCQPTFPEKAAAHKVTVDVNHIEPDLTKLFPPQLVMDNTPNNAVGLRFLQGSGVTIVASRNTKRYRLQSDSLAAVGVALEWLLWRLEKYFSGGRSKFKGGFIPPLPLNEYFEIIERHYKLRKNLNHCQEWMGRHAHQFRAIQKRLLTRFKDKTPVGLAHLDTLLDGTYVQLVALADKYEVFQLELHECSNQLSCTTQLIITLLRLMSSMNDDDCQILKAALSPVINTDNEQGWEEQTDAAISHLLRTTLAKSTRDQAAGGVTQELELPSDSHKIKKHIALACDRISKGWMPGGRKIEATQSLNTESTETTPIDHTSSSIPPSDGMVQRSAKSIGFVSKKDTTVLPPVVFKGGTRRRPSLPSLPEDALEGSVTESVEGVAVMNNP